MRAREPDLVGAVNREGVSVAYEVYGEASETIVLSALDPIVHSRAWKAQIPFLARHWRLVVIDPRGNGRSSRTTSPDDFRDVVLSEDTIAVMDAIGVEDAVIVGMCSGVWHSLLSVTSHPERFRGFVAIAPWLPYLTPPLPVRAAIDFDAVLDTDEGWAKENRHYWQRDYRGYLEFFFNELLPEPHSTKQFEDCVAFALEGSVEGQLAAEDAPLCVDGAQGVRDIIAKVRCPVLVIHGDDDRCQPADRAVLFGELTGGRRELIGGAGHLPMAREPVRVNLLIADFVRSLDRAAPPARQWTRPVNRPHKVLYLSSPIGLGHARRDLAIVDALRAERPGVEVDWLAQSPVTEFLTRRGERIHPASAGLASESAHIESEAGEHELNAFQAIRTMDEVLVANFMVFSDLVEQEQYDLWTGDESWELDYFLHENPELKNTPYAWMTDFVGWVPLPEGGADEAALTSDYNAEMLEQIARLPRVRDASLFVGNPDDVVDLPFGPDLPDIRAWVDEHYTFTGYVNSFEPSEIGDREALRSEFGYASNEPVCIVAVGGSGVGTALLRRCLEAYPAAAGRVSGLRLIVVTGPRIDPKSLPSVPGVEVHGFLPDLHRRLAAADFAVVQGGLTTTMELVTAGRPFVYVPLRRHFEQNVHVRRRLDNYGAGTCLPWDEATPEALAEAIACGIGKPVSYRPVETDGAQRAARVLAGLF